MSSVHIAGLGSRRVTLWTQLTQHKLALLLLVFFLFALLVTVAAVRESTIQSCVLGRGLCLDSSHLPEAIVHLCSIISEAFH
ncbi:hypothetical protein BGY98DRAFT_956886 [Russula aff. rugulosa BPL654]|nr:hypothetical protein BGY98DRAFT_956886 [Russula aff. rugulosa BPL654]